MEQVLLSPKELKRYDMVQARLKSSCKIEKILSDYGVSRRTFYVNLHKFESEGITGLKSKWGRHRKTDDGVEEEFVRLFKEHPYFSSYEFAELVDLKSRTIQRIIIRRKLTSVYKSKKERRKISDFLKKNQNVLSRRENRDKRLVKKKNRE